MLVSSFGVKTALPPRPENTFPFSAVTALEMKAYALLAMTVIYGVVCEPQRPSSCATMST